jgi:hypothetical protein
MNQRDHGTGDPVAHHYLVPFQYARFLRSSNPDSPC